MNMCIIKTRWVKETFFYPRRVLRSGFQVLKVIDMSEGVANIRLLDINIFIFGHSKLFIHLVLQAANFVLPRFEIQGVMGDVPICKK